MRDIWPLSERFDLPYVRRRRFPDNWNRYLSMAAVGAVAVFVAYSALSRDERAFSSGPLTTAHAMFANDCQQCHQPADNAGRYWLPPRDAACLRCHVATLHNPHQSIFRGESVLVSSSAAPIKMSGDCSACHVEHRGADVRLTAVPDALCIRCHADLAAFGRLAPDAPMLAPEPAQPEEGAPP